MMTMICSQDEDLETTPYSVNLCLHVEVERPIHWYDNDIRQ
jgi:hypothetical protein